MVAGLKDCVEKLAQNKGISKSEAEEQMRDVLDVIKEQCVENEGVSFKGLFSIKKVLKKGRKGSINGHDYETPDKYSLKLTVSSVLDYDMNN